MISLEGIDALRAAVVRRAVQDYIDLCRTKRGSIGIPYELSEADLEKIRIMYYNGMSCFQIAEKYHIPTNSVLRMLGLSDSGPRKNKRQTTFVETRETLREWFCSQEFQDIWCDEDGELIVDQIDALHKKKRLGRLSRAMASQDKESSVIRKNYNDHSEEMGA